MVTNWKFLTGTALLLSAIAIAPVNANSLTNTTPNNPAPNQIAQTGSIPVGRIQSISGSTVTVVMDDGMSKTYQLSSDMQSMDLKAGDYVGVSDDQIIDVAMMGKIVGLAGDICTVRLMDGTIKQLGDCYSSGNIGNFVPTPGMSVFVVGRAVYGPAREIVIVEKRSMRSSTQMESRETVTPVSRPAPAPTRVAEPVEQPVRGLW
jgi:hypothetical protein